MPNIHTVEWISLAVDENCSAVLIFCLFVQIGSATLDPITDIFRTMHVTAFGQHRVEATAPWGFIQDGQIEERVTPSDKKISSTDLAHFAMLSRGNCWLNVKGVPEPIPLTGGDCILLARGTSIVLRRPGCARFWTTEQEATPDAAPVAFMFDVQFFGARGGRQRTW
jgi:hypothetical protein